MESLQEQGVGCEDELQKLRAELRSKENRFKKEAAVLEQKVSLLEIQVKECKEREDNLRKMNENLTAALGDVSSDCRKHTNASFKELQQTLDRNSKDFLENKLKNNEIVKSLDQEIKKLQEALVAEKLRLKDLFIEKEQEKAWFEARLHEVEAEKARLESLLKQLQIEQRKSFENLQIFKPSKHEHTLQKLKELHEREISQIQEKSQRQIAEIKSLYSEKEGQEDCENLRKELENLRIYVKKLEESEAALKTLLHEYLHNFAINSAETPLISAGILTPQLRNAEKSCETSLEKSTASLQKTSFNSTAKTNEKLRNLPRKPCESRENREKTAKPQKILAQATVATALLCENCLKSYSPSQFLAHLQRCSQKKLQKPAKLHKIATPLSQKPAFSQKRTKSMHYQSAKNLLPCNFMQDCEFPAKVSAKVPAKVSASSRALHALEELSFEKKLIFSKLRAVERRLRNSEHQNAELFLEKRGLQRHFSEIQRELRETQAKLNFSQENRGEVADLDFEEGSSQFLEFCEGNFEENFAENSVFYEEKENDAQSQRSGISYSALTINQQDFKKKRYNN